MCQRVLRSKKSIITSLSLFIWTPDAEYLTLKKKKAGPWKIWTKRFMEANKKREVSNSVVQIHQEKILLRFFDVSWIYPFFSFKYTLNGVIKMDNLIILPVSKQVLLTLKSVIFVPLLLLFSLHPSPAFLSELSYPLFWTTGSHT